VLQETGKRVVFEPTNWLMGELEADIVLACRDLRYLFIAIIVLFKQVNIRKASDWL